MFSATYQRILMSPMRFLPVLRVSSLFLVCWIVFSCFPGFIYSAIVTLDSVQIFKTHEWLEKPTFYFKCQGENMTVIPDVKKTHVLYTFKGEESWQPLTEITAKKCKRCGFYEKDSIKSDDVFDEWEFCLSDFIDPDGKYIHFKNKEFNATFLCPECIPLQEASDHATDSHNGGKGTAHPILVIMISALVSIVTLFGVVAIYKYWQKRKREQDQARFLKLFEDGDDIEDELNLGTIIL